MIKLMVGILNLSLTAKYFGVSLEKDVWLLALSVVLFLDMAIWGPINETFRSKFIFLRGEVGEAEALQKTKSLLFFTICISIFLVCFVSVYPQFLANVIAPTYSGLQYDRLITMIAIAAPILLITQLSAISTSILNAYESFFVPEITGFITAILNLIILMVLAPYIGIYSLVLSYYIGAIILLGLLLRQINKLKIPIFKGYKEVNFSDFKVFFLFALPFFLPYSLGQVSGVLEKTLVSTVGVGYVSALDYSRKFTDIFISVLTGVLVTMLVPVLSAKYAERKPREFTDNFTEIFQLGILLLAFIIPIFTSSSSSIIKIFFDKGKISESMLNEISQLTIFYSWSTFAVFIYVIFGMCLLSSNQSKKYAFWGVIAQIVSILLNIFFVNIISVYIFPLSLFISHLFAGLLMSWFFPYKSKKLFLVYIKYAGVLFSTILISYFFFVLIGTQSNPYVQIFWNIVFVLSILLLFVYVFNLEEKEIIKKYYVKLKGKCLNS